MTPLAQIFAPPLAPKRARWLPHLEIPNELLINYIAAGGSYDLDSVEQALTEGNKLFEVGDFARALDAFAIAYEIYRLMKVDIVWLPLGHDLVLRRVLCLSATGRLYC